MKIIYRLFFLLISNSCFSQEYTDMWEMYKSSHDFLKYKSCYLADFSIKQNFQNTIFYKISSTDPKAESMAKQESIWGIYLASDSLLFLNTRRMGMRNKNLKNAYIKVREIGKYCHFIGEYVPSIIEKDKIMRNDIQGSIGGALGAAWLNTIIDSKGDLPYIMNLEIGVPHLLDQYYLAFILRDYPDLAEQFKSEPTPDELETQLKYVRLLNKF